MLMNDELQKIKFTILNKIVFIVSTQFRNLSFGNRNQKYELTIRCYFINIFALRNNDYLPSMKF